ncbi:MAG: membrane protein insertion efficiency factor YidD [Flavobacteriaceae bacterium]
MKITNPFNFLGTIVIRIYQSTKRRKYSKCLHYPSCSNYAILALKKYGFIKAVKLSRKRYYDCNPFSHRPYIDYP